MWTRTVPFYYVDKTLKNIAKERNMFYLLIDFLGFGKTVFSSTLAKLICNVWSTIVFVVRDFFWILESHGYQDLLYEEAKAVVEGRFCMFVIDKVIPGAMKSFMNKFNSYYKEKNSGPKKGRSKNNFANDPFLSEFKEVCSKYIIHVDEIQDFSIAYSQDFLRTKVVTEFEY